MGKIKTSLEKEEKWLQIKMVTSWIQQETWQ
jgi:hypothetical protein